MNESQVQEEIQFADCDLHGYKVNSKSVIAEGGFGKVALGYIRFSKAVTNEKFKNIVLKRKKKNVSY